MSMRRSSQTIIDHAEDLAAQFESAEPSPLSDEAQAAVTELRVAVLLRGQAESQIQAAIADARAVGVSWSVLAAVLGTSRQAVQQRYGNAGG